MSSILRKLALLFTFSDKEVVEIDGVILSDRRNWSHI